MAEGTILPWGRKENEREEGNGRSVVVVDPDGKIERHCASLGARRASGEQSSPRLIDQLLNEPPVRTSILNGLPEKFSRAKVMEAPPRPAALPHEAAAVGSLARPGATEDEGDTAG